MSSLKIALGQLLVEGGEPDRNFERAIELVEKAKKESADIIVLPECMDFGWTHPSSLKNAKEIPGEFSEILTKSAKKIKFTYARDLLKKILDPRITIQQY